MEIFGGGSHGPLTAKSGRIDVAMTPEKEGAEHGLRQDIEDAVKNCFGVGGDDVSTFGKTPGDRVQEPEENGPGASDKIGAADVSA